MRLFPLILIAFPKLIYAEPVQIPGPQGALEAEMVAVERADHAVIIIPGSGPTDRDGNSPQTGLSTDTYKMLAEGLTVHGITSLRIDKRGFYGSAGAIADPNDVTISAYADDVSNWITFAAGSASCVWLAGHSEGGLVALVAAQDAPEDLCGLILLATAGRPIGQILIEQLAANPANAPFMPEITAIVADLEAGQGRDPDTIDPVLRPLFSAGLQRYMIDLFSYDAVEVAEGWDGPVLIVQGHEDLQVQPYDADLLAGALPQAQRISLVRGTHMLKAAVAGDPLATYADPTLPLYEDLVSDIASFIEGAAGAD